MSTDNQRQVGATSPLALRQPSSSISSALANDCSVDDPRVGPTTDPARLCPYCNEVLPDSPSPVLQTLFRAARAKSWTSPRPNNPLALRAPMLVFVGICERHRFEKKLLPLARRRGWPLEIDFDALTIRIMKNRLVIDRVLENPSMSSFFRAAMDHVRRVGLRISESPMGQYATFESVQPGYYGERGTVVIYQTLMVMYPHDVLQEARDRFAPLSTQTFQLSVLVPETALALIMEDGNSSRREALLTMRASSRYGNLMFPDDDTSEDASDALLRAHAMKRREQIDKEEQEVPADATDAKRGMHTRRVPS